MSDTEKTPEKKPARKIAQIALAAGPNPNAPPDAAVLDSDGNLWTLTHRYNKDGAWTKLPPLPQE